MKKPAIIATVIIVLLIITGFVVFQSATRPKDVSTPAVVEEEDESVGPADPTIEVKVAKSKAKDNAIVISAKGLDKKVNELEYEISYDSAGQIKGVTTEKPIPVTGDTFEREIYLGTCSRNVCKPDLGVKKITVNMRFTYLNGKRTRYSGEFEL